MGEEAPNAPSGVFGLDGGTWLGIAGLVVTVVALALSIYFYRRQKIAKSVDYVLLRSQSLTTDEVYDGLAIAATWTNDWRRSEAAKFDHAVYEIRAAMTEQAEIALSEAYARYTSFQPIVLKRPAVHWMQIWNTGKEAIDASDFKDPISISVPNGVVVDVTVKSKSVDGIYPPGPIIKREPSSEQAFTPRLLNPGDYVTLMILTDGTDAEPVCTCWIVGQTKPMAKIASPVAKPRFGRRIRRWWLSEHIVPPGITVAMIVASVAVIGLLAAFWPFPFAAQR